MTAGLNYECECGHSFPVDVEEGKSARCPKCGNPIAVSMKEKNSSKKDDYDRLIDATFEIMGEGGVIFSGAR